MATITWHNYVFICKYLAQDGGVQAVPETEQLLMNNHKRHLFSFCIELFQGPGGFWIAIHWPSCFQGTRKPRNHMDPDQKNKWVKADVIADVIREVIKTW